MLKLILFFVCFVTTFAKDIRLEHLDPYYEESNYIAEPLDTEELNLVQENITEKPKIVPSQTSESEAPRYMVDLYNQYRTKGSRKPANTIRNILAQIGEFEVHKTQCSI